MTSESEAVSHPNFALIKYWGKSGAVLNIPAAGSISVTVDRLYSKVRVCFGQDQNEDALYINGAKTILKPHSRINCVLDRVRELSGLDFRARVDSWSNFPISSGLASSASAFSALALAASDAAGLVLTPQQLSDLARRGSGSAARSIYGGFVEMVAGSRTDGTDSIAIPLNDEAFWPLSILVAVTTLDEKAIGSSDGMRLTAATSPFYASWIDAAPADIDNMRKAIASRDIARVGELMEYSCLKLHGLMLSTRPGLIYWNEGTLQVLKTVRDLRRQGVAAYFTIDAGPQVKVVCEPADLYPVKDALSGLSGVMRLIETSPGPGARLAEMAK